MITLIKLTSLVDFGTEMKNKLIAELTGKSITIEIASINLYVEFTGKCIENCADLCHYCKTIGENPLSGGP